MTGFEKIYTTSQMYQAEIIKSVLEDNNIESFILNKRDSMMKVGDIEVLVKPEDVILARIIIEKEQLWAI